MRNRAEGGVFFFFFLVFCCCSSCFAGETTKMVALEWCLVERDVALVVVGNFLWGCFGNCEKKVFVVDSLSVFIVQVGGAGPNLNLNRRSGRPNLGNDQIK